jgi:hypothetical protein
VRHLALVGLSIVLLGCASAAPSGTTGPTRTHAEAVSPGATASAPIATHAHAVSPGATASTPPTIRPTASALSTAPAHATRSPGVPLLPLNGPLDAGRYSYAVDNTCSNPGCPIEDQPRAPLRLEITVPAGYTTFDGFPVIAVDSPSRTSGPDGGAVALGWPSFWTGLNSDPCLEVGHEPTDISVGPSVDDFVDAVVAHPTLDITEPRDVELGGYQGKFFSLTGPSNLSGCDNWRPWDPGFYVQGPDNQWDVWVIDADGFRVLIVAQYFPGTADRVKAELRQIAESITFDP